MDGMNQNNNPYGQQNDPYQPNDAQQVNSPYQANDVQQMNSPYQANDSYQVNNAQQMNNPYQANNAYQANNPYQPQDNFAGQVINPYNPHGQKKGPNVKVIIAGVACALVVLIGIGVGVLVHYRSTPTYKINKGFQNLAKEMMQTSNPLMEKIGMDDIMSMMQEDGGHVETEINLTIDLPFIGETTMGVDTDYYKDVKDKELNADTSFSVMNFDFAHLSIYANDEVFCFSIPELYMEDLYIENENVLKQYNRSIWADSYPINAEDFSIDLFRDQDERVSMRNLRNMANTIGEFEDDFKACGDAMIIEKVENGLYRVTIPQKEYDRLVKDMFEYYDKIYGDQEAAAVLLDAMYEYKKLIASDANILFEINSENRIESIMLENPVEILDGEASFEGELFFLGEDRSIDKIQGKITINGVDDRTREMLWQVQQTSDDDSYQMDVDIKFNQDGETRSKLKVVANSDAVRDEFDATCSYKDESDDWEIVLEGDLDDIEKGEGFELELDRASISLDGEELFKITGSVNIEPLKKSIKPSVQPKIAFFEMTESDWEEIGDQIENGYGSLFNYVW